MDVLNLNKDFKINFKGIIFKVESISKAFMNEQYILNLTLLTDISRTQNIEDTIKVGIDRVIGKEILLVKRNVLHSGYEIMLLVKVFIKLDFRVVESILLQCFSIDRSYDYFRDEIVFDLLPETQERYIKECGGKEIEYTEHDLFVED